MSDPLLSQGSTEGAAPILPPINLATPGSSGKVTGQVAAPILPPIDLATPGSSGKVTGQEVPLHTIDWANIANPFAWFILGLIAAVMLVPFIFFVLPYPRGTYMTQALDWAKTVLAPVVGFGGAVIGYYFGTRNSSSQ
jgi:hypothetical protein